MTAPFPSVRERAEQLSGVTVIRDSVATGHEAESAGTLNKSIT